MEAMGAGLLQQESPCALLGKESQGELNLSGKEISTRAITMARKGRLRYDQAAAIEEVQGYSHDQKRNGSSGLMGLYGEGDLSFPGMGDLFGHHQRIMVFNRQASTWGHIFAANLYLT
jgi:hypothetical protein